MKREIPLMILLLPEEKEKFVEASKRAGLPVSSYCRNTVLEKLNSEVEAK